MYEYKHVKTQPTNDSDLNSETAIGGHLVEESRGRGDDPELYRMDKGNPVSFVNADGSNPPPGFQERLDELDTNNKKAKDILNDESETTHDIQMHEGDVGGRVIVTYFENYYGFFENYFSKDKWIMRQNSRNAETPVFMNDAVREQYIKVSKECGFYGKMPKIIRSNNVVNEITLSVLRNDHYSNSDEAMTNFLTQTPNGKSKQRTMKDFKLEALRMEVIKECNEANEEEISVEIHVRPCASE